MSSQVHEAAVLFGRNVRALRGRGLIAPVVNPLIFFGAFYLVLHRALAARGIDFGVFFPPGVVVASAGALAIGAAQATARDRRNGLFTRYRTMPIRTGSILAGRLACDVLPAAISALVVVAAGLLIGFRFHAGVLSAICFVLLAVAFNVALAAGTGVVGLRARQTEAVASMLFVLFLPLINFSGAFVPVKDFPGWLQPLVRFSPFTAVAQALRALSAGGPVTAVVWHALAWVVGLAVLFCWLAARAFRRVA
ncbi:MAG TPA: ABC transporter permease [Streptosporangiaceae bacterium]|nr:ABC transporter permease [Streptosporangiaceae bacterium]